VAVADHAGEVSWWLRGRGGTIGSVARSLAALLLLLLTAQGSGGSVQVGRSPRTGGNKGVAASSPTRWTQAEIYHTQPEELSGAQGQMAERKRKIDLDDGPAAKAQMLVSPWRKDWPQQGRPPSWVSRGGFLESPVPEILVKRGGHLKAMRRQLLKLLAKTLGR